MQRRGARDADLVARAKEGDLDAFERLVVRHRTRLLDVARHTVGDRETAHDIVQEALLRAFRSLRSLREPDRFGPWLNTIVRRLCQQWFRGGRHRELTNWAPLPGTPTVIWGGSPEPQTEVVERVRAALSVLSQRERRVLILHYIQGLSCEEIARSLGIVNASVRRILHYSRRKVRKEVEMAQQAETPKRGPRQLTVWINGDMSGTQGKRNLFDYVEWTLAQSICLTVNKVAKTIPQIAEQVEAHEWYVEQTVGRLVEMGLLDSPKPNHHLATFIAFDAEDWRRLDALTNEPAGAATQRLAAAEPALRNAFEKTPLAGSGWQWEEMKWPVYALLICNRGLRHLPPAHRPAWPERPDGGRYYVGGVEHAPGVRKTPGNGLTANVIPGLGYGWYTHPDIHRERWSYFSHTDRGAVVEVLAEGPQNERELLARLEGEPDRWRGALAELVEQRLVTRDDGAYRLAFPVFRSADSDVLTPAVDALAKPIMDEIAVPVFADLGARLDQMGYGHLRGEYPQWHAWLAGSVMGQAVHFLLEQGVLPQPPDPAPPNFCMTAWEENLPLMS